MAEKAAVNSNQTKEANFDLKIKDNSVNHRASPVYANNTFQAPSEQEAASETVMSRSKTKPQSNNSQFETKPATSVSKQRDPNSLKKGIVSINLSEEDK